MTEQEYINERNWIDGQEAKLDYIMLCHSDFFGEETRTFLEAGFDVVCRVDEKKMLCLETLLASSLTGECEAFVARNPTMNLAILSMSRNTSIEWFIRD